MQISYPQRSPDGQIEDAVASDKRRSVTGTFFSFASCEAEVRALIVIIHSDALAYFVSLLEDDSQLHSFFRLEKLF